MLLRRSVFGFHLPSFIPWTKYVVPFRCQLRLRLSSRSHQGLRSRIHLVNRFVSPSWMIWAFLSLHFPFSSWCLELANHRVPNDFATFNLFCFNWLRSPEEKLVVAQGGATICNQHQKLFVNGLHSLSLLQDKLKILCNIYDSIYPWPGEAQIYYVCCGDNFWDCNGIGKCNLQRTSAM